MPSLLWIDASDRMLHLLCWGGVVLAAALAVGLLPGVVAGLLWLFYLSLVVAGQVFLGYQWDSLLLEAGFLAILLAPWTVWLGKARDEPWRWSIWLVRWLVFRLMFLSGLVKLISGDPVWWAWQALEHHYQTQPLPTWTSWYVHQLPRGLPLALGGVHVLRRADRPVLRARPQADPGGRIREPGAAPGPDRGDGQLRVLQRARRSSSACRGWMIATGAG